MSDNKPLSSERQNIINQMEARRAGDTEILGQRLRWEYEDAGFTYSNTKWKELATKFIKRGIASELERQDGEANVRVAILAEHLYFDVAEYYRDRIQISLEALELLKDSDWNENIPIIHHFWHEKAIHDLQVFEEASSQKQRDIQNLFLRYIRIVKPPTKEAFAELLVSSPAMTSLPDTPHSAIRQEEPAKEPHPGQRLKDVLL